MQTTRQWPAIQITAFEGMRVSTFPSFLKVTTVRRSAAGVAALLACSAGVLSGCDVAAITAMSGPIPGSTGSSGSGSSVAATGPARAAAPGPVRAVAAAVARSGSAAPVAASLFAAGAFTRVSDAGSMRLVARYWTSANVSQWSSTDAMQVGLSAHLENTPDARRVLVTGFHAVLVCGGSDTAVLREDSGQFVLTPPYEYGSAITVQCPHPVAAARLQLEYDLAVQTDASATADSFYRQTVLDSFPITFPGTAVPADTSSVTR